jgi:hypothetical protein
VRKCDAKSDFSILAEGLEFESPRCFTIEECFKRVIKLPSVLCKQKMVRKVKASAFLFVLLILCLTIVLPITRAQAEKPKLYVDPENNSFTTDTASVGTNFTVAIKAADFTTNVFSYELKLAYDNTMLEAVEASIPTGHWLTPSTPTNIFIVDPGTITQADGLVSFAVTLLGAEAGTTGSGTISTITFTITQAPTTGNLTCALELTDVILVDINASPIPQDQYDIINGNYVLSAPSAPPAAKPKIYVNPQNKIFYTSGTAIGTNFTISIDAANWTEPGVFSYEFKLFYDNTMLEAVSTEIPTGHWLTPSTPTNIFLVDPGTINQTEGVVSFAATLLGTEAGKTGTGTISKITFMITEAPPSGQNLSSTLEISDIIMVDPNAQPFPTDQYDVVNGNYVYSSAGPPTTNEDLNGDGTVNIQDIAIWGQAFGSTPDHPRWNPIADLNGDGRVDMVDAVKICLAWTT